MRSLPKTFWWALASLVAMVIGAFGPWATVLGVVTINGTDDGKDGWLVFGAAVAGAAALAIYAWRRRRWPIVILLLAGLAGAAVAAYDINDIGNLGSDTLVGDRIASRRWGIYLSLVASISAALAAVVLWLEAKAARQTVAPSSPPA